MTDLPAAVRLSALYVHPLNTRSEPPPADIETLADSIRSVGLLQNLMGFSDPDSISGSTAPDAIGIVAGGRRLRALRLIHGEDDPMIPVVITTDEARAREWAGAENTARAALHPADEVLAYRKMARAGAHANAIARAFAVTERHVLGRLRLAQLPDPAITALRAGQISLDQAAALTSGQSEEDVIALLTAITNTRYPPPADQIRRQLLPEAIPESDRRARYVGLMAYRCAGGRVEDDLFGTDTRLLDPQILEQAFADKLAAARDRYRAEGWAEVIAFHEGYPPHNHRIHSMQRISRTPVDLPEADREELERLSIIGDERELTPEEAEKLDWLESRAEGYFTEGDMATGTAAVYVDGKGELNFYGAFRDRQASAATGEDGGTVTTAKPEGISISLRDDMAILRRLAIQTALLAKPELVLDLLALTLSGGLAPWSRPLALSPTAQALTPSKPDETVIADRLQSALPERHDSLTMAALRAIQDGGKKERNAAITAGLARTYCRERDDFADELGALIGADVRKIWTPTAENYFKRLPGPLLDQIMAELVPDDLYDAAKFRALKKADKARQLHELFQGHDYREALGLSRAQGLAIDSWLPPELRFATPTTTSAPQEDAA